MDPIHPIVPQAQQLPPISPTPGPAGVTPRGERQRQAAERDRRRREQVRRQESESAWDEAGDETEDERGADDDGRPHIDISA